MQEGQRKVALGPLLIMLESQTEFQIPGFGLAQYLVMAIGGMNQWMDDSLFTCVIVSFK